MSDANSMRVPIEAQSIDAPLSRSAVFLVVSIQADEKALARVLDVISDIGGLVRTVGFRDLNGHLSCNVGIGSMAWDRLGAASRPRQLHPFPEVRGSKYTAVSTPGDLLFHIRSERTDQCFELERLLLDKLGDDVLIVDEVTGFRYFDSRDLLGFVDGTENPTGSSMTSATIISDDDPDFAGGSYVVVQKYLHDLTAWGALSTEEQERIVGRTKADNVELPHVPTGVRKPHTALNDIIDERGIEHQILRDNMPFGRPGHGEFGTYFIGYAAHLSTIEKMMNNMFIGVPEGEYDRILDFSSAVTGTTFFMPSNDQLENLAPDGASSAP
jgi:putative iron-dependent peroxidase